MSGGAGPVILTEGLVKRFRGQTAVDGLDLEVAAGACFGLLGPNGAGKSTTLKLLLGLVRPDAGRIEVLGHPVPADAREARRRIGVVPQADALDPDFTVAENLLVYGRYFGLPHATVAARLDELLEFAGLGAKRDARIHELSGGMKRRLSLARALVNDPELIVLDEPTTGLDPQARHLIWDRLRQLVARGKTLLLTTHFMEEAERLCAQVLILDAGRRIAQDTPAGLVRREIEAEVIEASGDRAAQWLEQVARPASRRAERVGETVFAYCDDARALLASAADWPDLRLLHRPANLEDVFLKLTGRDLRD